MMGSNELQGVPFMQRPDVRGQDGPGGPAHSTSGINDIPLKEVEDWKRADPFSMIGVAATCPSFLLVLDGGGVRGYSRLLVLMHLPQQMEDMKTLLEADKASPLPQ